MLFSCNRAIPHVITHGLGPPHPKLELGLREAIGSRKDALSNAALLLANWDRGILLVQQFRGSFAAVSTDLISGGDHDRDQQLSGRVCGYPLL